MTEGEFLDQLEEFLINASENPKIRFIDIKYIKEGQDAYINKMSEKDNPYPPLPDNLPKGQDYPNHNSWDLGWNKQAFIEHTLKNKDYLKYKTANEVILNSDW